MEIENHRHHSHHHHSYHHLNGRHTHRQSVRPTNDSLLVLSSSSDGDKHYDSSVYNNDIISTVNHHNTTAALMLHQHGTSHYHSNDQSHNSLSIINSPPPSSSPSSSCSSLPSTPSVTLGNLAISNVESNDAISPTNTINNVLIFNGQSKTDSISGTSPPPTPTLALLPYNHHLAQPSQQPQNSSPTSSISSSTSTSSSLSSLINTNSESTLNPKQLLAKQTSKTNAGMIKIKNEYTTIPQQQPLGNIHSGSTNKIHLQASSNQVPMLDSCNEEQPKDQQPLIQPEDVDPENFSWISKDKKLNRKQPNQGNNQLI